MPWHRHLRNRKPNQRCRAGFGGSHSLARRTAVSRLNPAGEGGAQAFVLAAPRAGLALSALSLPRDVTGRDPDAGTTGQPCSVAVMLGCGAYERAGQGGPDTYRTPYMRWSA